MEIRFLGMVQPLVSAYLSYIDISIDDTQLYLQDQRHDVRHQLRRCIFHI